MSFNFSFVFFFLNIVVHGLMFFLPACLLQADSKSPGKVLQSTSSFRLYAHILAVGPLGLLRHTPSKNRTQSQTRSDAALPCVCVCVCGWGEGRGRGINRTPFVSTSLQMLI